MVKAAQSDFALWKNISEFPVDFGILVILV